MNVFDKIMRKRQPLTCNIHHILQHNRPASKLQWSLHECCFSDFLECHSGVMLASLEVQSWWQGESTPEASSVFWRHYVM